MNQFVNPDHRGISLPAGCKNLIDLIGQTWMTGGATKFQTLQQPDYQSGTFRHIEFHLCRVLMSRTQVRILNIGSLESRVVVSLMYRDGALSVTVFISAMDCDREKAVASLFSGMGVRSSLDSITCTGAQVLRFPLPSSAPQATRLVADLLVKGFAVTDDAKLIFYHHGSPPLNKSHAADSR